MPCRKAAAKVVPLQAKLAADIWAVWLNSLWFAPIIVSPPIRTFPQEHSLCTVSIRSPIQPAPWVVMGEGMGVFLPKLWLMVQEGETDKCISLCTEKMTEVCFLDSYQLFFFFATS
mmetsp:Transcript_96344/g.162060  ORF Transcript_96344/g.162060 Transcript_96344/m.162060 type:complete len:116 (-) Transcript_96344:334-681(-)